MSANRPPECRLAVEPVLVRPAFEGDAAILGGVAEEIRLPVCADLLRASGELRAVECTLGLFTGEVPISCDD